MNFRRFIFAALAALIAASPSFAAVPRYVEGEAIVMLRSAAPLAAANSLSADGVPAIAKNSAAPDLGAVVVQSFRPVKASPQDGAEAAGIIRRLAQNDYAVIYITERLFEQCGAEIEKYTDQLQPAIIPIPGVFGNTGIGMELVSRSVERAVGSDILSNE